MLRVLAQVEPMPGQIHASDHWRLVRPFYELRRRGYAATCLPSGRGGTVADLRPDVVVLPRQCKTAADKIEAFVAGCHAQGTAVVVDWDDTPDLHERARGAPDAAEVERGAWEWVRLADAVTATTPHLRDYILSRGAKRAYWLPNLVSLEWWTRPDPRGRPPGLTIGVQGGDSHERDWRVLGTVWPRLARDFPDVEFVAIGYLPPYLATTEWRRLVGKRFHSLPWQSMEDHPSAVRWIDIGCCPLEATAWNSFKSPIKWIEHTLAGGAVVCSPTLYGDWVDGNQVGLAETPDDWYAHLAALIESPALRAARVSASRAEVRAGHSFTDATCSTWWWVYEQIHREVFGVSDNDAQAGRRDQPSQLWVPSEHSDAQRGNDPGELGKLSHLAAHDPRLGPPGPRRLH
jgi:glycosyltransferase involved in cell wall biosynthesis